MTQRSFRRASGDERSQALIKATLASIAEGGLQNATVRDIAQRAGVTAGLIRHYFPSKEALIQAAYRALMQDLTDNVMAALSDAPNLSAGQRLQQFIEANFQAAVLDSQMLSLWAAFISVVPSDPAMKAIHQEHYLAFRDSLEQLLTAFFQAQGKAIKASETEQTAIAINAIIDGLWIEGCLAQHLLDAERLAALAVQSSEAILGMRLQTNHEANC